MLKTNNKTVNEKIKKMIMEAYADAEEYYTFYGEPMETEYNAICKAIMDTFEIEKLKNHLAYKRGKISKQDLFQDWLQGLPSAFNIADNIFLGNAVDFVADILEETEAEKAKYTDTKAENLACYLFYRELNKHALKCNS